MHAENTAPGDMQALLRGHNVRPQPSSATNAKSACFDDGLAELVEWVASQTAVDRVDEMRAELTSRGLAV